MTVGPDHVVGAFAIAVPVFAYFIRIEIRLAIIKKDLCWIKKLLEKLAA